MRTIRLALLLCDDFVLNSPPIRAAHGDYAHIFHQFLSSSLEQITSDVTFSLDSYDVVKEMVYPPDSAQYDGLLISGARASASEDPRRIDKLSAYLKHVFTEKPFLKIFGMCFGHQILAQALGSSTEKGSWELSVTSIQLTRIAKAIFHAHKLHLQEIHQYRVSSTPPNAHLLGSSHLTSSQGMVIFDPASAPSAEDLDSDKPHVRLTSIRALTFQGHPEFTEPVMRMLLEEYAEEFGKELVDDALSRVGLPTDGTGKAGKVIWGVLGVRAHPDGASNDVSHTPE